MANSYTGLIQMLPHPASVEMLKLDDGTPPWSEKLSAGQMR